MLLHNSIGGFLSLDIYGAKIFKNFSLLNLCRHCLTIAIQKEKIRKLYVPIYTCPVVWEAVKNAQCECVPYEINDQLMPIGIDSDIPMLYTNYFGVCGRLMDAVTGQCDKVIADNSQAFYALPQGAASVYSPRKFFGLPDGGILWPRIDLPDGVAKDISWDACSHLLKRIDLGPEEAYADFQEHEKRLHSKPMLGMSALTEALLGNVDFELARKKRLENFQFLHRELASSNRLAIDMADDDVPMAYPYRVHDAGIRQRLIAARIYVPLYWAEWGNNLCMRSPQAKALADSIIPLPIDQRYDLHDMEHVLEALVDAP